MNDDIEDAEVLSEPMTGTALAVLSRAEIDTQIITAKSYPRSLKTFRTTASSMATLDEETACSMFYSLPRDGKRIEGPSARFAEVVATSWGNLRFGSRVVAVDDKFLTAQGVCHDLERNIAITVDVQRRITNKQGRRYSDDMIVTTGNAAGSIAMRNAVLKVIPKAYWNPVFVEAKKVAIGDARTLVTRRNQAIDYFTKLGVTVERVLSVLGRESVEAVNLEDLETLTGLRTAIKDGDTTIEEAFPEHATAAAPMNGRQNLRAQQPPKADAPSAPASPANAPPTPAKAEEAPPASDDQMGVADFLSEVNDQLQMVRNAADLQPVRASVEQKRQWIGEANYTALTTQLDGMFKAAPKAAATNGQKKPPF